MIISPERGRRNFLKLAILTGAAVAIAADAYPQVHAEPIPRPYRPTHPYPPVPRPGPALNIVKTESVTAHPENSETKPVIFEYPVYIGEGIQAYPVTDGTNIAWHEITLGPISNGYKIFAKDPHTGEVFPAAVSGTTNLASKISAGKLAYANGFGIFPTDIHVFDLPTRKDTLISEGKGAYVKELPSIDNDIVVWVDFRYGNSQIYAYNLKTGKESLVYTSQAKYPVTLNLSVSGNFASWNEYINDKWEIAVYDIAKQQQAVRIARPSGDLASPSIAADKIAYSEPQSNKLFIYDLTTGQETEVVCPANTLNDYPIITNGWLFWSNWDLSKNNGNMNILGMDLSSNKTYTITNTKVLFSDISAATDPNPPYNSRLVWDTPTENDSDIYGSNITYHPNQTFLPLVMQQQSP